MELIRLSELTRVMQCFGSTIMNVAPIYPPSSSPKEEGEAAHWLAKAVFKGEADLSLAVNTKAPNGFFITEEMVENVSAYLNEIAMPKNAIFNGVDIDLSFGGEGWNVAGRADHIAHIGQTLYVDAFHYGFRIVSADDNWSLIGAAIGYCIKNNVQPSSVLLTVHQPRGFRPKSVPGQVSMEYEELCKKFERIAEQLTKKQKRCTTGNACGVCPYSYACAAFNSAGMNAIDISEAPIPQEPKGEELSRLLDDLERAKTVIAARLKSLHELATHQIGRGQVVPNYILEASTGAMEWTPGLSPEMITAMVGQNVSKPAAITPQQAKKQFAIPDVIIQTITRRKTTAPKLTRVDGDKHAKRIFQGK